MFFELKKKRWRGGGVGFCEFQALNISVLFEYSSLAFYFQVTYDRDGVKTTVTKTIITDGGRGGQLISKKRKKKYASFCPFRSNKVDPWRHVFELKKGNLAI